MSRIYLKKRKNSTFWIKDILDSRKLGKISAKEHGQKIKIKAKFKKQMLKAEASLLLQDTCSFWDGFYQDYIASYNKKLTNSNDCHLPAFVESCRLAQCENDIFDRKTFLHPAAKKAWSKMQSAAQSDDVILQIVSAYRSLNYQKQLINNKLAKGISIKDILKVNALPGFSEHHTGCAIDITSTNCPILETDFDQTLAFTWLMDNAKYFHFYLSYPKNNNSGIIYEPWHWCYK